MIENQSILILSAIFLSIYIGIFLRYYFVSRGIYSLSKSIFVKLLIRVFVFMLLIFCSIFLFQSNDKISLNNSVYVAITQKNINSTKEELNFKIINFLNSNPNIQQIGCIYSNVFGSYALVPLMKKEDFIAYINRFQINKLPKIKLNSSPKNIRLLLFSPLDKQNDEDKFLNLFVDSFNVNKISELRNYLLILSIIIFGLDILFVKKSIKS